MNDIYNQNIFEIQSIHSLEFIDANTPFRWSDGIFKIIPKEKVKNLCLNFKCLGRERNLVIFLENKIKNTKYECILEKDSEYIIIIPIEDVECISFHVSPNMKINNDREIRTLGVYIKKIYTNDIEVNGIEIVKSDNINFKNFLIDKCELRPKKFLETSFYEQVNDIKFLDLKITKRKFEFNSSIFVFDSKKYLITRCSQFVSQKMTINHLKLYEYDTLNEIKIDIKEEVDFEQFEDPRVLIYNDNIYISCATFIHDAFHLYHQKILVFDKNFNHIDNIHLKYGFNGKSLKENTGIEKNWTFFVYKEKLMCIYKLHPHTVLEFDWNGNLLNEYISHNKFEWKYGIPRGGTNPVYKDGYYHSFFHSHLYWGNGKRRYFMGKYKFLPEPPFSIVEVSEKPILWGNEKDERLYPEENPLCVFPCGLIIENDKFVVSLGVNDEKTAIITI